MRATHRYETTLDGTPTVLEVRALAAVPALRVANRLGATLAAAVGSRGATWLSDEAFAQLQRELLAEVTLCQGATREVLSFDQLTERVDAEAILGLLWGALQVSFPRSFSKARAALADPASLLRGLSQLLPLQPRPARAASAPTAPAKPPSAAPSSPKLSPSAY